MINLILSALLSLLSFNSSYSQDKEKYNDLVNKARDLYENEDYKLAAEKYSEAFTAWGDKGYNTHRYYAASAWALAKEPDSAFVQLFRIAEKGNYSSYGQISTDPALEELNCYDRWAEVLAMIKKNKEAAQGNLEPELVAILDTIYRDDQDLRQEMSAVEAAYGRDSEEMQAHWDKINKLDSINVLKVQKILDERGWLGADVVGDQGNSTLFLVIQHAPLEVQEKYLPMFRDAVKKGNASPGSLALMEDRVALRNGERQIYGSQIGRDPETGEYYVSPLQDPENIDPRRAEVGLKPLEDYVATWDIVWNAKEYKECLSQLEAKIEERKKEFQN
ncbi:DUF6624 domain-containing protein [Christiangramia sediminis]|uniref:Tetratricopeptide repeat protein n=1 Tax=Christiangramia sediminis TaxID=2881336 RepID=A0A9X1RY85_9FLAO|nr:DUF6624 domain-containing protein [Christiangramia sediminis]MCB7482136.1 hypothetical protein [Christiangramia sediminis]